MPMEYKCLIDEEALINIRQYKKDLAEGSVQPGAYLKEVVGDNPQWNELTDEQFIVALVKTKKPKLFVESEVHGDGRLDWNSQELLLLGDIDFSVPVTIYNDGCFGDEPKAHEPPFKGTLLFVSGVLLKQFGKHEGGDPRNDGAPLPEYLEVVYNTADGSRDINRESYYKINRRRLLAALIEANDTAKKNGKTALITMTGQGCGAFAGDFKATQEGEEGMGPYFLETLTRLLKENGARLSNIKVDFDPYNECEERNSDVNGVRLKVRPLKKSNKPKEQLCRPEEYAEAGEDFSNCEFFSVVPADHGGWPGNDFWHDNSILTAEGRKTRATDLMYQITGVPGEYDPDKRKAHKYMPPDLYDDWEGVVRDKGTVFDVTGKISVYSSQAGKLVQLQGNELRDDDKVFEAVVPVEEEEVEERKDHPEEHEKKEDNKQGQENIGQTARLIAVELEERLSALKEQGANDHETLDVNKQKSDEIVHNAAAQALQGNMTEADLAESQKEIDKIPMSKTRRALIGAIFGVLASVIAIIATHGVAIVPLLAGGKTIGSSAAGGAFVGAVTGLFNRGSGKKTGAEGGNANDTPKEPPQSPSKR